MKKILLAAFITALSPALHAQLTLTGTSYTQNFDGISSGLPTGWTIADSARANFIGHLIPTVFQSAATNGTFGNGTFYSTRGGFKNYPSADAVGMGSDSATQVAATDRAIGVRQVTPTSNLFKNSDPGAAFLLQLTNTTGFQTFTATFKLQSLDTSSPRVTTWKVDYGFGATPTTFTPATVTGTMTTGGNSFTNNTISVNFGTALNNKSQPVWIRIVTMDSSTGSGNRASTTIDDFSLNWAMFTSGTTAVQSNTAAQLQVLGQATANNVALRFLNAAAGEYNLVVTDINGSVRYNNNVTVNSDIFPVALTDLHLAPGMYVATMHNTGTATTVKFIVE